MPTRMCVICRERLEQKALIRLQYKDERVISYQNGGRSFYLCGGCILSPKLPRDLARRLKIKEPSGAELESLKEKTVEQN
ncbi:hypothetical protein FACS189487_08580 [Campylobacterota bacterium]|nr:hypothetical protein FACS189487_08580 [Campylobacterota bacterium]